MRVGDGRQTLARQRDHRRVRAAAELQLVRVLGGKGRQARRPRADEQRHAAAASGSYARPSACVELEEVACEARLVRPRASSRRTISHVSRIAVSARARVERRAVEPRAGGEPEERAAAGLGVERRDLAGDLDRVRVNGLSADGPTRTRSVACAISSSGGSAGWKKRSLKTVTTSKPAVLGAPRELGVGAGALVALEAEPELAPAHVSSAVGIVRRASRSMRMIMRSSGSGTRRGCPARASRPPGACAASRAGAAARS